MRRIAILGTGPRSRGDAPYDDPSVEIWTIARGMYIPPRVDLLFELHVPALWDGWGTTDGKKLYVDCLKDAKVPVVMQEVYAEVPLSKRLPKDEILKVVTPYELGCQSPYQTSQVSWMMCYALYQMFSPEKALNYWMQKCLGNTPDPLGEILFYGIDLISEGEARSYQRHCLEYYVGMARGLGIKLTVADKSTLCKHTVDGQSKMYAYDYPLTREEAVWVYGHPMRQLIKNEDGSVRDVREVPGLLGMPMVDKEGSRMIVVGNLTENYKILEQENQKLGKTPQ